MIGLSDLVGLLTRNLIESIRLWSVSTPTKTDAVLSPVLASTSSIKEA